MTQTRKGAKKAAATMKQRYGEDYFSTIGHEGGKQSAGGGFASNKVGEDGLSGLQRASVAGKIGGQRSRAKRQI